MCVSGRVCSCKAEQMLLVSSLHTPTDSQIDEQAKWSGHEDSAQTNGHEPHGYATFLGVEVHPTTRPQIKCQKVDPRRRCPGIARQQRLYDGQGRIGELRQNAQQIGHDQHTIQERNGHDDRRRRNDAAREPPARGKYHQYPKRQHQEITCLKNQCHWCLDSPIMGLPSERLPSLLRGCWLLRL